MFNKKLTQPSRFQKTLSLRAVTENIWKRSTGWPKKAEPIQIVLNPTKFQQIFIILLVLT